MLAGDLNLRLERQNDPHTVEFNNLLAGYGLQQQVVGATHDVGGTLDVVCTRSDLPAPTVDIVGLSAVYRYQRVVPAQFLRQQGRRSTCCHC